MKKSNTSVLAARPYSGGAQGTTYESRSVRKIDNGYVVSETKESNGNYKSCEYYCPEPPDSEDKGDMPQSSMRDAIKTLQGD